MLNIYTDGSTLGNPGPTGLGVLIVANQQQVQLKFPKSDHYSNHEAEFLAAIAGFTYLTKHFDHAETIMFFTDSRLLSDAIGKGHSKHYPDLLSKLDELMGQFALVVTQWIPDKDNHGAHNLALQALHSIGNK